jgi:hypothetical protein
MPLKKEKLSMFVLPKNSIELLLGHRVAVSGGSGSLSLGLSDHVGLVDSSLYNLLFLRVEVLCKVLVQHRLFLLKLCCLSACVQVLVKRNKKKEKKATYEAVHA